MQLAEQKISKLLSAAQRSKGGRPDNSVNSDRVSEYTEEREAAGIARVDASRFREAEHIPPETVLEYAQEATKTKEKPTRKNDRLCYVHSRIVIRFGNYLIQSWPHYRRMVCFLYGN